MSASITVPGPVPQLEYMYGCTATAIGMMLGYYDLYGYMGYDVSNLIPGTISVDSRGSDGNIYNQNEFNSVLGRAVSSKEYVYRFFDQTPETELKYAFVGDTNQLNMSLWNCLSDYLGTSQFWRGNEDYSTTLYICSLADVMASSAMLSITYGGIKRQISLAYSDMTYGLSLYVKNAGYSLNPEQTATYYTDNQAEVKGSNRDYFTFDMYKAEIDAGRLVCVGIEGHSMLGYGYDAATKEIIFDDTYFSDQRMTWGGSYFYAEEDRAMLTMTTVVFNTGGLTLLNAPTDKNLPDLVLAALTPSSDSGAIFLENAATWIQFTVTNSSAYAAGATSAAVYVNGIFRGSLNVGGLGSGESLNLSFNLGRLSAGAYSVKVEVDPNHLVLESDTGNNSKTTSFTVLPDDTATYPDFVVSSLKATSSTGVFFNRSKATIRFTVSNNSDDAADASYAGIYLDDVLLKTVSVRALSGMDAADFTCELGVLSVGTHTIKIVSDLDNRIMESDENNNSKSITVDVLKPAVLPPDSNLNGNARSQILAWDSSRTSLGYVSVTPGKYPYDTAQWCGVWSWEPGSGSWDIAGSGRFASNLEKDGVLLYNRESSTFAAWTNLESEDYGYVSLGYMDSAFRTKAVGNFTGNVLDDIVIQDSSGSFGLMVDGTSYQDIWHVEASSSSEWQIVGSGYFGGLSGCDDLLLLRTTNNSYYLWHNNDTTFQTWDWSQKYLGSLSNDWEIAGTGDFQGDGIDDIVVWQKSTGYLYAWENGSSSNRRWIGRLDHSSWEVAAVGDYNGDGKDDLLLRELTSGWGGLGYWRSARSVEWADLNAHVENNAVSNFSVIA